MIVKNNYELAKYCKLCVAVSITEQHKGIFVMSLATDLMAYGYIRQLNKSNGSYILACPFLGAGLSGINGFHLSIEIL
ncbi:hypothetical protein [Anaerocolumna jejuensis]|uniref:hypothetical protein n=1 Tax=Anaerocolumna jejuensis TaxID=259063 RepID=UPI000934BE65|nr:hypothetical protein [Anaerocolumna jejuensis]